MPPVLRFNIPKRSLIFTTPSNSVMLVLIGIASFGKHCLSNLKSCSWRRCFACPTNGSPCWRDFSCHVRHTHTHIGEYHELGTCSEHPFKRSLLLLGKADVSNAAGGIQSLVRHSTCAVYPTMFQCCSSCLLSTLQML